MCSFFLLKFIREKNEIKNREKLKYLKKKFKYNNIFLFFWVFYLLYVYIVIIDVL